MPTELARALLAGEVDVAPIPSIEWARNADRLKLLPRLCVSSEGAVDSIQLVSSVPLERIRSVAVTPESATSVVLARVLLPGRRAGLARGGGGRQAPDRRRGAAQRLRGSDPAPRPGPDVDRAHRTADGLRRLGDARSAARGDQRARGRPRRVGAPGPRRAGGARAGGERALRLPAGLPRPLLREAALPVRPARARRALHVHGARPRRRRARPHPGPPLRRGRGGAGDEERRRREFSRRPSTASGSPTPRR